MSWDANNTQWKLESSTKPNLFATTKIKEYPFGTHTWDIYGDDDCVDTEHELVVLNINTCELNQFNCGDGACIEIDLRCNGNLDCPDGSGM